MNKQDKHNGVEKEKLDQKSELNKNDEMDKTSIEQTEEEVVPKGKLKWSKQDELQSTSTEEEKSSTKEEITQSEDQAEQTKVHKVHPKGKENTKDTKSEQKEQSSEEAKPLAKNKNYSLEDTLGPIAFKEYSIDPKEEQSSKSKKESSAKETDQPKLKPDPKVKKEAADSQATKPFVFSTDDKKTKSKSAKKKQKTDQSDIEHKQQMKKAKINLAVKILWLPIALIVVLLISLIIGHTVIGDQPASDIFDFDMWIHLYKLIFTK